MQWTWPETYEKDKFAVMIEGMHIGMALLKFLGDWLTDRICESVMMTANVKLYNLR